MASLYYGSGTCTIEGTNIRGVQIKYRGRISIEDKTSSAFITIQRNNGIMIFPNVRRTSQHSAYVAGGSIEEETLNELFDYVG